MKKITVFICSIVATLLIGFTPAAWADTTSGLLGVWGGWTQFQDDTDNLPYGGNVEDWVGDGGFVNPGTGGQSFDAEYLFYKLEGTTLSIGIQTGFDIENGFYTTRRRTYYPGDIALSFDGTSSYGSDSTDPSINGYEYALDFGFYTEDYDGDLVEADGNNDGKDTAGLYSVSQWNTNLKSDYLSSNPYAMDGGSLLTELDWIHDSGTTINGDTSYYQRTSFDISFVGLSVGDPFTLDAHWTMLCGNDMINGRVAVPEPSTLLLLGSGLLVLGYLGRKRIREGKKV